MEKDILNFPKQFSFSPNIENNNRLLATGHFIVYGLGGSHLSAGLLKSVYPEIDLLIHRDYGLARVPNYFLSSSLSIFSSFSGNTEEVIDSLKASLKRNLAVAVISSGGKLLKLAIEKKLPYIQMPASDIPPRLALGYSLRSLLALTGRRHDLYLTEVLTHLLDNEFSRRRSYKIIEFCKNKTIPIFYSSNINMSLAYLWKIFINETAKQPAFYNLIPEANHNELESWSSALSSNLAPVFLTDENDHPAIKKRMLAMGDILDKDLHIPVHYQPIQGENRWHKIISSVLEAMWTSHNLALNQNQDPDPVPIIENFKHLIE